ncbi:MAG: TlpA family protein disulfide reductase [Myxococcales bacterium]|nr:TlpA family protein disulfide reductase [Myxococcales bacterium]
MSDVARPAPPRRTLLWLFAAGACLFVLGVLAVWWKAFGTDPHRVPFELEGQPAPTFTLRRLDNGEPVSFDKLKGNPLVLNFWATWCGPCRQEHPVLEWAAGRFGDKVQFYGVVFEDSEENARRFIAEHGARYPQLIDPTSTMAVDYGVTGVPETYFIDRDGIIRGKVAQPIDPQTMTERIRELVAPPAPDGGSP